jgi:prepilin-type N-terminal cleavage/methylation domain-containing protein
MKTKGFTLIELVVASTLLIMLTSMATTTAYNFIQAVAKLKAQFENLRDNISGLYATVSSAKMAYEADLAVAAREYKRFGPKTSLISGPH